MSKTLTRMEAHERRRVADLNESRRIKHIEEVWNVQEKPTVNYKKINTKPIFNRTQEIIKKKEENLKQIRL